jgi:hypothetical protein
MKSLLDPTFKYVPSTSTNIRRTFARVRKQLAQQRATAEAPPTPREMQQAINDLAQAHLTSINLPAAGKIH